MEERKSANSMLKGFLLGVSATLAVFGVLFLVRNWEFITGKDTVPTQIGARAKVETIYQLIEQNYLGETDGETLTDSMCAGLVAGLDDKYSTYYTQEQYEQILQSTQGHYAGIGVGITREENGDIVIAACYENTPAQAAGIREGDLLLEIDGQRVKGLETSEVVELIQQVAEGNAVDMALEREGVQYSVSVTVEEVESVSVTGRMLEGDVGYIQITQFTGVTAQQFEKCYQELLEQKMGSLVIDLRSNPGGLVNGVCDTLRQILPEGIIVYTEDKYGNRSEELCDGESPIGLPLAVLVNGSSASASEIFAGAVQDYGIGTIVGTVTYGKGVVQDTYPLKSGGAVKLTVSNYFTPKGNNINGRGITPDVEVEQPEDAKEDLQLKRALEVLQEG